MFSISFTYCHFTTKNTYTKKTLFQRFLESYTFLLNSYIKLFLLIFSSNFLVSFSSFVIPLFCKSFGKIPSIYFGLIWCSTGFTASTCVFYWSSIVFIGFSKAGNIYPPVRYSYLLILLDDDDDDDDDDIFAVSLLISYCSLLSLILSIVSVVLISFYILCKRFFLKRKRSSNARVVSIIEKEYGFACSTFFCKDL